MIEHILAPGSADLLTDKLVMGMLATGCTMAIAGIVALFKMSSKVSKLIDVVDITLPGIRTELHEVTADAKAWREKTDQTLNAVYRILERHDVKLENLQRELDRRPK